MKIVQNFITKNRSNIKFKPLGCVLHSTATPGATDENEREYFNSAYRGASAHAFVDWDSITQTIPWDEKGWHAGTHANSLYNGVEMCEPSGNDPVKFKKVWNSTIELFAWLFINVYKIKKVTKDNLPSHAEISSRFPKETDHQDPVVFFKKYGKTVDDFRNEVQKKINKMKGGK